MEALRQSHAAWCRELERAVLADAQGQMLDAVDCYETLAQSLVTDLREYEAELTPAQGRLVTQTTHALERRATKLSALDDAHGPTRRDMEDVLQALRALLIDDAVTFPLELAEFSGPTQGHTQGQQEQDQADAMAALSLSPPLPRAGGATYVDVQVVKVGLKDAGHYVNPTVVVSVFARDGQALELAKETRVGTNGPEPKHLAFPTGPLALETSLATMETRGAAVFLEVMHFKPKKRKKSCRCWALLELDEIQTAAQQQQRLQHEQQEKKTKKQQMRRDGEDDGEGENPPAVALALELYDKPVDPKRKRLSLFTTKDLFLHVQLRVQTL